MKNQMRLLAYRDHQRWVQTVERIYLKEPKSAAIPLREQGVYLITGGLGGVGLTLAEYLAQLTRPN